MLRGKCEDCGVVWKGSRALKGRGQKQQHSLRPNFTCRLLCTDFCAAQKSAVERSKSLCFQHFFCVDFFVTKVGPPFLAPWGTFGLLKGRAPPPARLFSMPSKKQPGMPLPSAAKKAKAAQAASAAEGGPPAAGDGKAPPAPPTGAGGTKKKSRGTRVQGIAQWSEEECVVRAQSH